MQVSKIKVSFYQLFLAGFKFVKNIGSLNSILALELIHFKCQCQFEMSFCCHQIDQKTNEIFERISALASKMRLNQKKIMALYTPN